MSAVAPIAMKESSSFRVIYASRTHKQLQQAMKELKRTTYAESLVSVCLASRDLYCANPDVARRPNLGLKN